jgi:structural maintenance of chromosome 1
VVENKAVAKECINYLRDQRVGTCVFLPLDNINPPPLSEKARSFGERYKPCLHLLKFDEQYKVRPTFVLRASVLVVSCSHTAVL